MKKVTLILVFMMPMILFGQSYESLWKKVEAAQKDDLPRTELEALQKIVSKAEKEKAYGQLLKAYLQEMQAEMRVSPDSLQPAVERLQQREQQTKDDVLGAVLQAVLGTVYADNRQLADDSQTLSKGYYDAALSDPEKLAAVKTSAFVPFVKVGEDSKIYDDNLLSVIAYEAHRFDILRDYYLKVGNNRKAMLMASLEELRYSEPTDFIGDPAQCAHLQRLDSLMEAYADLDEAGEVALEYYAYMADHTAVSNQQRWEYIEKVLPRWGQWPRMNRLRNEQARLKGMCFSIYLQQKVNIPNREQKVELRDLRGVSTITMRVYRVNATAKDLEGVNVNYEKSFEKIKRRLTEMPELSQTRAYEGKAPYEFYHDSMALAGLPVGIYLLEFESVPQSTNTSRALCYVSNLRLLSQMLPEQRVRYVVVNATTGQPVREAKVQMRQKNTSITLTTDNQGECIYDGRSGRSYDVYVTTADDKACPEMNSYGYFSAYENNRVLNHTKIFTDRAIYRPGQAVHASAILFQTENGYQNSVQKGKRVTAALRDANYKVVEERELITDEFGTCAVDFTLPRKGLSGRYSVRINGETSYFRVEEYKRPTFEVEIPDVEDNYADGDTLQVKGTARSYAGVPVQMATVKYKVERKRPYWWWSYSRYWNQGIIAEMSEDMTLASGEVMTDNDGTFTMPVPLVLPKTRYPIFYNFVVTAEVTDQAGETHQAELSLPLGNRKTAFSMDVAEKILAESGGKMTFHLRNAAGVDMEAEVRYRLDDGKWQTGTTKTDIAIPKSLLKSGRHSVEAICEGDTVQREFIVFSLADQRPAVETDDWFYISATQFPNDGTPVTVQVGSSAPDVHIVYTMMAGNTLLESGAVDKSNALVNRKLTYREAYGNGVLLTFAWVKEGKTYTHQTTIRRPLPDMNLKLKWQTFRDRLLPGQQEEWALTIMGPDGKPANAQLLATLYDKSLDQLTPHAWSLAPYVWLPLPSTSWRYTSWGSLSIYGEERIKQLYVDNLHFSQFDHSVFPTYERVLRVREIPLMMAARMKDADEDGMLMEKSVSAPVSNQMELADVDSQPQGSIEGLRVEGAGLPEEGSQDAAPQVRENLNETAFFYPQLTTDKEGRVVIRFTLPESLTTWRFMGVAHTQDMMTGMLEDETVAKKDVMIQPNMPRFVRVGDKTTIAARIINSGEKAVDGKARLELLDPETLQVVYSDEQDVKVDANTTIGVTFPYDCSQETRSLLVAKVMVVGDEFSDGEQHYLPVLPNQERVTVTVPFTQNEPGTKTIDLNSLKPQTSQLSPLHSQLTIEYTNNPAWLMIQALPTVGHPHDNCALCQATSYYANAIGRHILKQNPQAKTVFEAWSREDTPSSLQSQLSKNQELKDLLLDETPWVTDANREQEQKERLADFFDENLMQQRLSGALEQMKKLQLGDGSWSWWPGMVGSMYMTVEISEMLVRLNQMTEPQKETGQMLTQAFGFMGNEIVEMVKEMKKQAKKGWPQRFPSHMALQWLYICTLDGRQLPNKVNDANAYLINLLKKETRNQSIYDKAMSAIVLNNQTYIQSLKEYTVYREEMGRYYDTPKALYSWRNFRIPTQVAAIEAIKRLTPDDTQTITEMQRWLLQEKRNQAWDTPINSVDAIYAFLNGNSETLAAQPKTVLRVDGEAVPTSEATAGIGYVKTAMSGDGKQTFTAEKTSTGTSWGAVYMQFMQHTSDIEAQSSGITVKRELLTANGGKLTALKVGDKVTVRITITADRDYDFVQIVDKRAACMEPVRQLSGYGWGYYCTPKDCSTNFYFDLLSKGKHVIETEYYIDRVGTYETGTCTAGCAYSPEFRGTAPSLTIEVKE